MRRLPRFRARRWGSTWALRGPGGEPVLNRAGRIVSFALRETAELVAWLLCGAFRMGQESAAGAVASTLTHRGKRWHWSPRVDQLLAGLSGPKNGPRTRGKRARK